MLRQFTQKALFAIKRCFLHAMYSCSSYLNTMAFRLLIGSPKRALYILRPILETIYNTTHRYIISYIKTSCENQWNWQVYDKPSKRLIYPLIALFIGIQLTIYQLIVFAYPAFEQSEESTTVRTSPRELARMRTSNSKHFLNPDGTMTALLYATPVHYKDANGEWNDIDTDIGADRKIDTAPYQVSFDENPAYRLVYKGVSAYVALKTNDPTETPPLEGTDEVMHENERSPSITIDADFEPDNKNNSDDKIAPTSSEETLQTKSIDLDGQEQDSTDSATADGIENPAEHVIEDENRNEDTLSKIDKTENATADESPTAKDGSTDNTANPEQSTLELESVSSQEAANSIDTDRQKIKAIPELASDNPQQTKNHFKSDVDENEVRYENVLQDTDLLLSAKPYSIEKWLILKSNAAPDTFEFKLETNKAPQLVDQHLEWGEVATLDCYAVDSSGVEGKVDFSYSSQDDSDSEPGGIITLKVDKDFLANASYPVKVDPTMTLNPSFDNGISGVSTDTVYRTETNYLVGKTSTSLNRMLLWFNMSSLTGKTINSAVFSLFENGAGRAARTFRLYRVTEPWNTTYTSWARRDDGVDWTTAGGTYNTTRLGLTYTSVKVDGAEATFDITKVAQKWALGTFQNYGLLFRTVTETNNLNNCGFYTSEQGGSYQPKIEINYIETPSAPTGLTQYNTDHITVVPTGGTSNDGVATNLYFDMSMTSPNATDTLTPRIEIRPIGTVFTGVATHTGSPISYDGTPVAGSVAVTGLDAGGSYHWQAWTSNASGNGTMVSYGENADPDDIDIMLGSSISLSIDSTYNRDGTPGSNSVDFGSTDPTQSPFIIDNDSGRHALQLTVISDSAWSLRAQASGNLIDSTTGRSIAISQLRWREHGSTDSWISFQTTPYTILSGQAPTSGTTIRHNYRFTVGWIARPGNYGTALTYTLASP